MEQAELNELLRQHREALDILLGLHRRAASIVSKVSYEEDIRDKTKLIERLEGMKREKEK